MSSHYFYYLDSVSFFSFNVCITTRKDDTALRDQIQKAMIVYGIRQMGFTDLYFELKMQSTNLSVPFGFQSFFSLFFVIKLDMNFDYLFRSSYMPV